MTADESIERLVNRFGQTISDLPKPTEYEYAYNYEHRRSADKASDNWEQNGLNGDTDYICHLCDVIDRMEAALETAVRWSSCTPCDGDENDKCDKCIRHDNFRITDELLEGRYLGEPLISVSTEKL